jgi:tRNA threonylcarbamoyladenosine biosynthesis protein TsaB
VLADEDGNTIRSSVQRDTSLAVALPRQLQVIADDSVTAVVVVTGPGSYTGVRAGMAAALGLAQSRGLELYGVTSLQVIAYGAPADAKSVTALAVAGRGGADVELFDKTATGWASAGPARHVALADWAPPEGRQTLANAEAAGAMVVDEIGALVAAIPAAVNGTPLTALGLQATQVAKTEFVPAKSRV